MPLLRGATSKIILAHLSSRSLVDFYHRYASGLREAGLGEDLKEFRRHMTQLRRQGYSFALSEVDRHRAGIAAPVHGEQGRILGSLSYVIPVEITDDKIVARLSALIVSGARQIEAELLSRA